MRGSHGLPPSLLGPIGKRFRRQTVPHMLTPEACPTRRSHFPAADRGGRIQFLYRARRPERSTLTR